MSVCNHLKEAKEFRIGRRVCEECVKMGDRWVHLRQCLTCGHIGCCDSSKNTHATKHFGASHHPVIQSAEPGENWAWCYVDETAYDISHGLSKASVME